ncbi:Cyclin [Pelomyxa schiedti]|nr:Cyclin [Pelomyxa schiedti]
MLPLERANVAVALFFAVQVDSNTSGVGSNISSCSSSRNWVDASLPLLFSSAVPSDINLLDYVSRFNEFLSVPPSCCLMACILAQRAINNGLLITHTNVHRVILVSILVATKFLLDEFQHHMKFAAVGGVSVQELRALEVAFLRVISFDIWVEPEQFVEFSQKLDSFALSVIPTAAASQQQQQHCIQQLLEAAELARYQMELQEQQQLEILFLQLLLQNQCPQIHRDLQNQQQYQQQQYTGFRQQATNINYNDYHQRDCISTFNMNSTATTKSECMWPQYQPPLPFSQQSSYLPAQSGWMC